MDTTELFLATRVGIVAPPPPVGRHRRATATAAGLASVAPLRPEGWT
jgi:hypothetical protein